MSGHQRNICTLPLMAPSRAYFLSQAVTSAARATAICCSAAPASAFTRAVLLAMISLVRGDPGRGTSAPLSRSSVWKAHSSWTIEELQSSHRREPHWVSQQSISGPTAKLLPTTLRT